jgi:small subunit ribosomal protein S2
MLRRAYVTTELTPLTHDVSLSASLPEAVYDENRTYGFSERRGTVDFTKAGVHLGHHTRKWNPKMRPFIYKQKDNIHLLDLVKSHKYFKRVLSTLTKATAQGQSVLFIGTRASCSAAVTRAARRCRSFYVTEKWLGGMLTNWSTLQHSTRTLRTLESQHRSGELRRLPKKEMASALRLKQKLNRNLGGVRWMTQLPRIAVIIGQNDEMNALAECDRVGLRHISLLDTDNDPTLADLFVPANDDSPSSVKLILDQLVTSIRDGQSIFRQKQKIEVARKIRRGPSRGRGGRGGRGGHGGRAT